MFSMMQSIGWGSGFLLSLGFHMVAMLALGVGIAFLLFWAFKHLSERELWKWGWILAVVGLIFCLLTIPVVISGMFGVGGQAFGGYSDMMDGFER